MKIKYIGFALIVIMIIVNLFHALNYYGISEMKLPDFYLWQADS